MPITVQQILDKEFKTKPINGYDPEEVDNFLDEICDEFEAMQEEIGHLRAQLTEMSRSSAYRTQPKPAATPAQPAAAVSADASESAARIIAKAQRMYDEIVAEAEQKAAQMLDDAKAENEAQMKQLLADEEQLRTRVSQLRADAGAYRKKLLELLDQQRTALNDPDLF